MPYMLAYAHIEWTLFKSHAHGCVSHNILGLYTRIKQIKRDLDLSFFPIILAISIFIKTTGEIELSSIHIDILNTLPGIVYSDE